MSNSKSPTSRPETRPKSNSKKTSAQRVRHLRKLAHSLKPVILLGKAGFTESVLNELENALSHHELIKIKLSESDRDNREILCQKIVQLTKSELVQKIGQVLVIYRPSEKQVITFN